MNTQFTSIRKKNQRDLPWDLFTEFDYIKIDSSENKREEDGFDELIFCGNQIEYRKIDIFHNTYKVRILSSE